MKVCKQFFKHPQTIVGIVTAFAFLFIFFCVWMTAYSGVNDRVNVLSIGLVNEDTQLGTSIEQNVMQYVPFKIKQYQSIESAKQDLNQRKLDMVMQIPANFSSQLQEKGKTDIHYYINQANASLAKQIMDGTARNITEKTNENVYMYKQQLILSNLSGQIHSVVPSTEAAQDISKRISQGLQSLPIQSVQSSVEKTNNADGFAPTMIPLMIVLASFVGSMIMSLNIHIVSMKLKSTYSKWSIFIARQIINIGAAILLAVITLLFLVIFKVVLHTNVFEIWMFQTLVFLSFISLTQMFVVLFGPAGMIFNILSLSVQLVTSGVIVPKEMLSNFYKTLGSYFPATYAADGYYSIIYGGINLSSDMIILLLVAFATLAVTAGKIVFQKKSTLDLTHGESLEGTT